MQAYAAMRTRKTTVARFAVLSLGLLLAAVTAQAQVSLIQISTEPFTNPTSQHATLVEPDTFSFGWTVVAAFQSGGSSMAARPTSVLLPPWTAGRPGLRAFCPALPPLRAAVLSTASAILRSPTTPTTASG